ncbi:MAG: N-6 DNA methylase, partial [Terriglobales bacterium]
PMTIEGDAFGKIYEYFLGKFAMSEGQKGGEFFTPTSIVKLIVEIIEPFHGQILDPASGSGGMFVQSAAFVEQTRPFQIGVDSSDVGVACGGFATYLSHPHNCALQLSFVRIFATQPTQTVLVPLQCGW